MAREQQTAVMDSAEQGSRNLPLEGRARAVIESVSPEVDGGRFAAKRTIGDQVRVEADVFTDGHDSVAGVVRYRFEKSEQWQEVPLQAIVNDRWYAVFPVENIGRYRYTVQAWVDHWLTWRKDLLKRIAAETDTALDYRIGAELVFAASRRCSGPDSIWLGKQAHALDKDGDQSAHREIATGESLHSLMLRYPDRQLATDYGRELELVVDPVRARFSSWYEFFPRSTASESGRHGTFADCEAKLPYVAEMGFDILYLPPIHPIGVNFRKGKNNAVTAEPGDLGSPWAIGAVEGGHKSIHPQLGTLDEFRRLVRRAQDLGIQVALDVAFQAAPDHPYVQANQNWFKQRPDGTIQYAENPPKKYQDIYPFDFESQDWSGMWEELASVFFYWIEQGVRIFRVDNPHTKAFPFWEWCITKVKAAHPDVLFLSEAFTRPKVMYRLAKLGFSWSYTYFPWRTGKFELMEYLNELTKTGVVDFFRPNQWPNTPDILPEFLQRGTRSAFMIRYLLAATIGANYGIYGPAFELMESRPVRHGSEEYLDSEKYQIRSWNLDQTNSLRPLITLVNRIRRENVALQNDRSIQFHDVDNDQLLCFTKQSPDGANTIAVVINLDSTYTQTGFVNLDLNQLGIAEDQPYQAQDLLTGTVYTWRGRRNYVELNPQSVPAHILQLRSRPLAETNLDYFA
jgi:starch synthase (maltosyl-transferring)